MPVRHAGDVHEPRFREPRRRLTVALTIERCVALVCLASLIVAVVGAFEGVLEFLFYPKVNHPFGILFRLQRGLGWGATMGGMLAFLPIRPVWVGVALAIVQVGQCAPEYLRLEGVTVANVCLYLAWAAALVVGALLTGRVREALLKAEA